MTTHSFVGINGQRSSVVQRPGGTSPDQLWTDFVHQQCSIRLVLSGHYHSGDLGEANRSDNNRCGQPVQQILTDYQDRPNGGDGWLRHYTVDPAAGTIAATTYSPKLDRYETDADSSFTLPFVLGQPEPAPWVPIGTSRIASGGTASVTWTGLKPDTEYEWRAVASDATASATSPIWTVRTPANADLVDDTFARQVSNGWGAADAAHAWQTKSTASAYAVDGAAGRITAAVGATRGASLTGLSATEVRITTDIAVAQAASGSGTYVSLMGRLNGASSYRAKVRYLTGGNVSLSLIRYAGSEVTLATATVPGLVVTPGMSLRVRLELDGLSPTTLRAAVWRVGSVEPAGWTVSASDATTGLQAAGSSGIDVYTSSSAGAASTLSVDRFTVSRLGAPPPPPVNQPPDAVIAAPTVAGLTVEVSASGSSDPDGSIVSHGWAFGDGGSATGATANHTFATAGTYPVTLTVTDDDGATDSATSHVTVTAPATGHLAADEFGRTVTGGWGAADTGGAWSLTGATTRYAVAGGVGQQILATPGTTTYAALAGVSAPATDLRLTLSWSRTASAGTLYASVVPRRISSTHDYRCKIVVVASGAVTVQLVRRVNGTETTLATSSVTGLTQTAGQGYRVACRAVPAGGGTQVSGKLWRTDAVEPTAWQVTSLDTTAALQGAGGVGVSAYQSSGATQPTTLAVDGLTVVAP